MGYYRALLRSVEWAKLRRQFFAVRQTVAIPTNARRVAGVGKQKWQRRRCDVTGAKDHAGRAAGFNFISPRLEHIHQICSDGMVIQVAAVFLALGFVSAQLQGFQPCAFTEASPKTKNLRRPSPPLFCQCSNQPGETGRGNFRRYSRHGHSKKRYDNSEIPRIKASTTRS